MSIYATLWRLKFPRDGEDYIGCEWIEVIAQGVPAHVGSPTPGYGYEDGDPYGEFLPPPLLTDEEGEHEHMRAVVFVTEDRVKGTARHPQEYANPLLVLTGEEYARISFEAVDFTGVFEALKDPAEVAKVRVDPELGTVCWPSGADLDPDVLYSKLSVRR